MDSLLQAIDNSSLNALINSSAWLWPLLEILHFAGLTLLLGAMLVVDLRLIGFWRGIDIMSLNSFVPCAVVGFVVNLLSGSLFFIGDPLRYATNPGFIAKMLLIAIAGLNALWFFRAISPVMSSWDRHGDTPAVAKVIAGVSLIAWFAVLLLGRLLPYIGDG